MYARAVYSPMQGSLMRNTVEAASFHQRLHKIIQGKGECDMRYNSALYGRRQDSRHRFLQPVKALCMNLLLFLLENTTYSTLTGTGQYPSSSSEMLCILSSHYYSESNRTTSLTRPVLHLLWLHGVSVKLFVLSFSQHLAANETIILLGKDPYFHAPLIK